MFLTFFSADMNIIFAQRSKQDLDLHVMQHTPATVRVSGAQARSAGSVLLAALHRHTGDLEEQHKHTHTHTWLKVHARFPARARVLTEVSCARNTRFKRKTGFTVIIGDEQLCTSAARVGFWTHVNTPTGYDYAPWQIPLCGAVRGAHRSPEDQRTARRRLTSRDTEQNVTGGGESKYPPAVLRSWATCEHRSRGPSSPALCIITLEFIPTPAFLVF